MFVQSRREKRRDLPLGFGHQSPRALPSQLDVCRWLWSGCQRPWCLWSEPVRSRERMVSDDRIGSRLTHVEDLKNPIQLRPPTRNLSLPIARSKVFDQFILPGQFVDLALYFLNAPVIKSMVVGRS